MQERVHPQGDDFDDVIVQYTPDHMMVGIGLEPRTDIPQKHFIDKIYGDVPTLTEIGRIFRESLRSERNLDIHEGFSNSNPEHQLDSQLGRLVLDAVTGSRVEQGMWTCLDRPAVNRLIRLLRKGRDSAFGRDE